MWQDETSHLTWDQKIRWGGEEKRERKEREEEGRERSSTFSLVFSAIGLLVSVGARGKVLPYGKCFK